MNVHPGKDVFVVMFVDSLPMESLAFQAMLSNKYEVLIKVHYIDSDMNVRQINSVMHSVYRSVAGCFWREVPSVVLLIVRSSTGDSLIRKRLTFACQCLANNSLSKLLFIHDVTELDQIMLQYPLVDGMLFSNINDGTSGVGGVGNLIRETCSRFLSKFENVFEVLLVGAHPYQLMTLIEAGLMPVIVDMDQSYSSNPFDSNLVSLKYEKATVFRKPLSLRLRFLTAVIFSSVADEYLFVGGAPGQHLAKYNYVERWPDPPKLTIIDPKFNDVFRSSMRHLRNKGWEVIPSKFNYSSKLLRHDSFKGEHLIINDDAYSSDNQLAFTLKKIRFYSQYIQARAEVGKTTLVYVRYNVSVTIHIPYFEGIMLQPGINDSTEVRVIMSNFGFMTVVDRDVLFSNIMRWRTMPLRQQFWESMYYFQCRKKYCDFYDIFDKECLPTIALFALSSTINGTIDQTKDKLCKAVEWYDNNTIPLLFTLPNFFLDVKTLNESSVTLEYNELTSTTKTTYFGKSFSDYIFDILDLIGDSVFDVQFQQLLNYCGQLPSHGLTELSDYFRAHVIYLNRVCSSAMSTQDGKCSPGPIIKAWTMNWRLKFKHSNSETYALRLNSLLECTNLGTKNEYQVRILGSKDITFTSLKNQTLSILKGPLKDKSITLLENENITISGHVLNILMASIFGMSQIGLWIMHWKNQQVIDKDTQLRNKLRFSQLEYLLFDYNSGIDVGDKWHSKNDVILALAIFPSYAQHFNLPIRHDGLMTILSTALYSVVNR